METRATRSSNRSSSKIGAKSKELRSSSINSDFIDDNTYFKNNKCVSRVCHGKQSPRKILAYTRISSSSFEYDSSENNKIVQTKFAKKESTEVVTSPQDTPPYKVKSGTLPLNFLENVTSPKQKCVNSNRKSPSNIRSPSTLFKELDINSLPLSGFPISEPVLSKNERSVYQIARKALYNNVPITMPGRENELSQLINFIKNHVEQRTSGSLYISGPPGSGKTATLGMMLQRNEVSKNLKTAYINCTGIKSPEAVYSKIVLELEIICKGRTEKEYIAAITQYLTKSNHTVLLVLDEIDQLKQSSNQQRILYSLFSLPSSMCSLVLIGISNSLDLTDRLLPRLQSRSSTDAKPQLLHFVPYNRPQIVRILTTRLRETMGSGGIEWEVFDSAALEMLAGKVAAMSGDVRKALDIGRRLVDMLEGQQNHTPLPTSTNMFKSIENDFNTNLLSPLTEPKTINLHQVVNVLNSIYGTSEILSDQSDVTFPLQQKIIISSLLLYLRHGQSKDITVGKLHEIYKRICARRNIVSVDQAEFYALLSLVESRGIIRVLGKKERRLHKVSLEWDEEEVRQALRDKEMINNILQDKKCLQKLC